MRNIDRAFKSISEALNSIAAVVAALAAILFAANSLLRFIFKYSLRWADELSCYSVVIAVFLMLVVLDYGGSALSIDYIYAKMKKGSAGKRILDVVQWIASTFVACMLAYSGFLAVKHAIDYNYRNITIQVPYSYIFGLMLAGIVIMLAYRFLRPFLAAAGKEDERL